MIEIKKINKIMYKLSASFFIYFYFFIFYYYLFFKFDSYNGRESLNLKCHEHIKNIAYVCTTSIRSAPQFLNYIATQYHEAACEFGRLERISVVSTNSHIG